MSGGGAPTALSLAAQTEGFCPGRSPKPAPFDRHLASLAQNLAPSHRDHFMSPRVISVATGGVTHAVSALARSAPSALSQLPRSAASTGAHSGVPSFPRQTHRNQQDLLSVSWAGARPEG